MISPTIVMDFTTRTVSVVGIDPAAEHKIQSALAAQQHMTLSAGGTPPAAGA
ncbi:MAG: hypothetical protein JWM93_1394 [Frankiales bacterium]|nr:hypothetical protein [Frankiales bacterium]